MTITPRNKVSSETGQRTVSSTALACSYELTRARAGVCLKRTDRRQSGGREQLLITSMIFIDSAAFSEYCRADPLARSDPFAANLLARAFHELLDAES